MTRLVILGALAALSGCWTAPTSSDDLDTASEGREAGLPYICEQGFFPRYRTEWTTADSGTTCADGSEAQAIAGVRRIDRGTCETNFLIVHGRYWVRYGCRKNISRATPI